MCSGTKLMPTQIPIQNDNCLPCRDEREEKQLRASRASSVRSLLQLLATSVGELGSYPLRQLLKFADCSTTAIGETD